MSNADAHQWLESHLRDCALRSGKSNTNGNTSSKRDANRDADADSEPDTYSSCKTDTYSSA